MEPLATQYKKYGYIFKQVSREGDVAVYSQSDEETGQIYAYEVFIIQKQKATVLYGRAYPDKEIIPGTSMWGQEAYTVTSLTQAEIKVKKLQERIRNRVIRTETKVPPSIEKQEDPFGGLSF